MSTEPQRATKPKRVKHVTVSCPKNRCGGAMIVQRIRKTAYKQLFGYKQVNRVHRVCRCNSCRFSTSEGYFEVVS